MEKVLSYVDKYMSERSISGLSNEQYLMMCEQMGVTPDPAKLMTGFGDFPIVVQKALVIYGKLTDRYISLGMEGSTYDGKDYSGLPSMLDLYRVKDERQIEITIAVIDHVNSTEVNKARAARQKSKK